jgi:hypothetical protein
MHASTEDQLVVKPAIRLFAALGWTTVSVMEVMWRRFWRHEPPGKPTPDVGFALSGLGPFLGAVVPGRCPELLSDCAVGALIRGSAAGRKSVPRRGETHQPRATPWELGHPTIHQP